MYDRSGCNTPIPTSGTNFDPAWTGATSYALNEELNGSVEFLYATDLQ